MSRAGAARRRGLHLQDDARSGGGGYRRYVRTTSDDPATRQRPPLTKRMGPKHWAALDYMAGGLTALVLFFDVRRALGRDSVPPDFAVTRYNSDLANGLGNLASRTLTMIHQYRNGVIPDSPGSPDIAEAACRATEEAMDAFCEFNFSRGLETLWAFISVIDKFIVERAPWKLGKDTSDFAQKMLNEVLYSAAEALRILCAWTYPVMPNSARNIWIQLGMTAPIESVTFADFHWGKLPAGQKIGSVAAVFPRLDESAIVKMENLEVHEKTRQAELFGAASLVLTNFGVRHLRFRSLVCFRGGRQSLPEQFN